MLSIRQHGVEALTLRDVGARLRVSRTALYRHFADKTALLAAVAAEGFRAFRLALVTAWESGGPGRAGFEAMGMAYVRFALEHPSHYRVMFGGFVAKAACDPELTTQAESAFHVLVHALVELQQAGLVGDGEVEPLAVFVWSSVHGVAMLGIDGQPARPGVSIDALALSTVNHAWRALAARADGASQGATLRRPLPQTALERDALLQARRGLQHVLSERRLRQGGLLHRRGHSLLPMAWSRMAAPTSEST